MGEDLWKIIGVKKEKQSGDILRSLTFIDYYLDLLSKIIVDITSQIDVTLLTPEAQDRLNKLNIILQHSSIDFSRIDEIDQAFKINGIIDEKDVNNQLRELYLNALMMGK